MRSKTMATAVTLVLTSLFIAGLVAGLGWWMVLPAAAIGLAGAWIARNRPRGASVASDALPMLALAAPMPADSERTGPLTLPSSRQGAPFRCTAKVHWATTLGDSAAMGGRAVESILSRARAVAAAFDPDEHELLTSELGLVLGEPRPDANGVEVWATDVRMLVSERDTRHFAKINELRRYSELWELSTEHERKVRAYLQNDALATPANAVVWWLSRDPTKVEQCAELMGVLGQLSEAASGRSGPTSGDAAMLDAILSEDIDAASPALADRLLARYDDPRRRYVARCLADLFEEAGDAGLAAEIRSRNDVERIETTVGSAGQGSLAGSQNGRSEAPDSRGADDEAAPTV